MHDKANNSRSHKISSKDSRFLRKCLFCMATDYDWCDWFLPSLILWRKTWQVRQLFKPLPVTYESQPPSKRKTSHQTEHCWGSLASSGNEPLPLGRLVHNQRDLSVNCISQKYIYTRCVYEFLNQVFKRVFEPQFSVIAGVLKLMSVEQLRLTSCSRITECYSSLTTMFTKPKWENGETRPKMLVELPLMNSPSCFNSCRHASMFLDHRLQRWTMFRSMWLLWGL